MAEVKLSKLLSPAYYDVAKDVFKHGHTHYDFSGGRGSAKSSAISLLVPVLMLQHRDIHALILRKVRNTLRDSVYSQYCWAIGELGLAHLFKSRVSPMELEYLPTGQKIMFRGADDPMKIKSIKVPFGYIGITHFEEKDQFAGRAEIRNILQSTMRGGPIFWNFESYNPPRSRDNWANEDTEKEREDRFCHKSTYLTVPPEWLGPNFIYEAEHLKETDPESYKHEYLGVPVGYGGNVFDKLEIREITDDEIKHFDRIYMGVDWGYFPDPFAFIRLAYDSNREKIYLLDELYVNKWSNEATGNWIKQKKYLDSFITCDSAEPKSIADFRAMGLPAKEAVKGPGSIEYGMKALQKRTIVIDKKRTPKIGHEIIHYEYERTKEGEIISGFPDKNNHGIDAIRYATERAFKYFGVLA